MLAKHTPGKLGHMAGMPTNLLAENGMRVARCDFDGDFDSPEANANAARIVLAWNAFDAFVDAFERIVTESETLAVKCPPPPHACHSCEILFVAREALKLARPEAEVVDRG